MNTKIAAKGYQHLNIIFILIILLIFLYAGLYQAIDNSHTIPSIFTYTTKLPSLSTGLSRNFSAVTKGQLIQAHNLNPQGLGIILFLIFQLILRSIVFILIKTRILYIKFIILADTTISILTFLLAFKGMIRFTFMLFHYFIVN